jgi:hypothetical protein
MATDDTGAVPRGVVDDERRSLTQPGGLPGQSIYDRVVGLEYELRLRREKDLALEARLREGAQAFSDLRKAVAPQPLTLGKVWLPLAAIAITLLGFVWAAARYPDRHEFDAKINSTQSDVATMRVELAKIAAQLDMAATIRAILKESKP